MKINEFINFEGLFKELLEENKEYMQDNKLDSDVYFGILNFTESNLFGEFSIMTNDCELNDNDILFVFTRYLNNANESDAQSDEDYVEIAFDRELEEFSHFIFI